MMDNGNLENRADMLQIFEAYLRARHEDWSRSRLIYSKWRAR